MSYVLILGAKSDIAKAVARKYAENGYDHSPGPVACFSDEDDVSGNQNNCYWPLHSESITRCKYHMQEKLVYCCTCLENL